VRIFRSVFEQKFGVEKPKMNLDKLVDKMFVRAVYWETGYHAHLLKITTYSRRHKPNRVREYVWANNYGAKPKFSEISIYHLDCSLKYNYTIKKRERR